MSVPSELRYTADHEWVRLNGDVATIGITAYAASALGDIVFVQTPRVGQQVLVGQACGEIESTKSVSDLIAPVSGEVTEVNSVL
ncbi:MAG TPA: glycine cleavage system protein H, partial [Acidothermaceae bacterium]|nr:glycine cleavage system protein H [Acidothermaceae bacterium]